MKKYAYTIPFLLILSISLVYGVTENFVEIKTEELQPLAIVSLGDQDVYFKSSPRIAVDLLGNLYALGNQESELYKFDKKGKLIKKIARSGEGPGEISYPGGICITEKYVFVSDISSISIFDLNDTYLNRFRKSGMFIFMTVFNDTVLLSEALREKLITVYDLKGEKLNSFGEKYNVNSSIYETLSPAAIDWMIHRGKAVCNENNIFYISFLFGDIFKYDAEGKLLLMKELDLMWARNNKKLFFKDGMKFGKENLHINKRIFNDALIFENKMYLLVYRDSTSGEIWQFNLDKLIIEKKFSYLNQVSKNSSFRTSSFAISKDGKESLLFYTSIYDHDTGDTFICKYARNE